LGDVAYVPLTKGLEATIDAADIPKIEGVNWCTLTASGRVYAFRGIGKGQAVLMHRALVSAPTGMHVDHIDGDGLNNRRSNLRVATRHENAQNARLSKANTSGAKGVSWCKTTGRWKAQIMANRKAVLVGRYDTVEAAAAALDFARDFLHGNFARSE